MRRRLSWLGAGVAIGLLLSPAGPSAGPAREVAEKPRAQAAAVPLEVRFHRRGLTFLKGRGTYGGPTDFSFRVRGYRLVPDGSYTLRIRSGGLVLDKRIVVRSK